MMTKTERSELSRIVRQQFKVLRGEVDQREVEMKVDVERQIEEQFASGDQQWSVIMHEVHEAVQACNRAINDVFYKYELQTKGTTERSWINTPNVQQPVKEKTDLRRTAYVQITEQVKAAKLNLDRREADLLRDLSIGAMESEEARQFLSNIPTVGELVPATRLAELAASIKTTDDDYDD